MNTPKFVPLSYREYPVRTMKKRAVMFRSEMQQRRSVRQFSDRPVPREIIEEILRTGNSAPSGANAQPWHFVVVSDPQIKQQIREGAEKTEKEYYQDHAVDDLIDALKPIGTEPEKPFLEAAPYLVVVFCKTCSAASDGHRVKNHYVKESVGIAVGMLIAAVQHAGLACLTYTPTRMNFLNRLLQRPRWETPNMILVVGYPAEDAQVPDLEKKSLEQVATFL